MTRFRLLIALPFLWVVVFLVGVSILQESDAYRPFLRVEIELVKLLSLVGSWIAAFTFERKTHMRRAWFFCGLCMLILLLRDLTVIIPYFERLGSRLDVLQSILAVLANACAVIGNWLLAKTWRMARLSLSGSRMSQLAVVVGTVLFAFAAAGPGVVSNAQTCLAGDISGLTALASSLADIIGLCLIGPLLLTALALRGGLIGWPWAFITASLVAWLLYDGILVVGKPFGLDAPAVRIVGEVFRALACMFTFSAGMAQHWVLSQIRDLESGQSSASI